jgi:sugar-specific transcriptional regulator TrmB
MAGYALADMLADFAQRPQRPPRGDTARLERTATDSGPKVDIDALLAEERERTERTVGETLAAAHEAALLAERERHAAEIAEINRRHGEEFGVRLETGLREAEARIVETISGTVARILAPIASDEVLKRSIEELARAIDEALDDADAVTIRVSGPTSLFSALAFKMGDRSKYLRHHETADADLTVDVDGGLMETRLAEWQAAVHEVLA